MSNSVIRIDIPDAKPATIHQRAGQICIDAIKEAGLDPLKVAGNAMGIAIIQAWGRGEFSRDDVIHSLRNLLILNPSLAKEVA